MDAKAASGNVPSSTSLPVAPELSAATLDMRALLAGAGVATYAWDIASDAIVWSANAADILRGVEPAALTSGRAYATLVNTDQAPARFDTVMQSGRIDTGSGVAFATEYGLSATGRDGANLWVEDFGCWYAGADGRPARVEGMVRVVSERRERETALRHLAERDPLTGELNRHSLGLALDAALSEAVRAQSSFGFILLAVDHLARLNDAFGFNVADEVIGEIGRRLRARLRANDRLGRFSGNKFGIILKSCTAEDMDVAAERFLTCIREEVVVTSSGALAVTASAGGVIAPRHGQTTHDVMARAHEALDGAKSRRRGSFFAWRPSVERDAQRRASAHITAEIVSALNERRVILAYEPVVCASNREVAFHECLMRVRRADGEILRAPQVVPIAEQLGLIRLIDHRVLELVVSELAARPDIRLSLNTSPDAAIDADWWQSLESLMRAHPGVAERMIVEITETAEIQNIDDLRGFVARIKDLGGRIAIDDFGAGFTSFRNLRRLGVDIVKIDGAFVQNVTRSGDDRAFVHTLLDLAQRLGLTTVAEWVQDEEAARLLADWGCDYLQGKLIGLADITPPWPVDAVAGGDPRAKAARA